MPEQPKFPLSALGGLAVFAAIMVGVHFATGGQKGMDTGAALQPILQFPQGRSAWLPIVPADPPPSPEALALPHPPVGHFSGSLAAMLAANPQASTDYLDDAHGALDHFYAALQAEDQGHSDAHRSLW